MRPTTWRLVLAIAALSGAVSFGVVSVWTSMSGALPEVPWPTAVLLVLFAAGVLLAALVLRPRMRRDKGRRPMDPLVAARFAVLALTSTRAGSFFVGVYGGYLAVAASHLDVAYRRRMVVVSGLCVLGAVLLVVAGWVLERACRLPPPSAASSANGASGAEGVPT